MSLFACCSKRLSVGRLLVSPSFGLPRCLYVCLSVCLAARSSAYPSVWLCLYVSVYVCACACLCVCLSICLLAILSVCLCLSLSVFVLCICFYLCLRRSVLSFGYLNDLRPGRHRTFRDLIEMLESIIFCFVFETETYTIHIHKTFSKILVLKFELGMSWEPGGINFHGLNRTANFPTLCSLICFMCIYICGAGSSYVCRCLHTRTTSANTHTHTHTYIVCVCLYLIICLFI